MRIYAAYPRIELIGIELRFYLYVPQIRIFSGYYIEHRQFGAVVFCSHFVIFENYPRITGIVYVDGRFRNDEVENIALHISEKRKAGYLTDEAAVVFAISCLVNKMLCNQ